tara:strand:- start:1551 stop:3368 length:1818 start_codon:yes stop_codon:yes gene_type:complete
MAAANSSTRVVDLDFDTIKTNLKTFMKGQSAIRDYDFEGSNINVLLDVLSYNTYLNNFYLNMLSNEMFLDTALEKDSVVAHAKELNYVPRSAHGAVAYLDITINPDDTPNSITIPKWTEFQTSVDGTSLVFSTQDEHVIKPSTDASTNTTVYTVANVAIYEGRTIDEFAVVDASNNYTFTITNANVDTRHLTLKVRESQTSTVNSTWTKADTLFGVNASSNVFFLEPTTNDQFKITFGDGVFGRKPAQGQVLEVQYRNSKADAGNNAKKFSSADTIQGYSSIILTTVTNSTGGRVAEPIEDIKFNAPKAFQVQERAVTAEDYKIIIQREFPEVKNILAFGGENLTPPKFGKVIVAVDLADADGVPETKKTAISDFLKKKSPVGIEAEVVIPDFTYIESNIDVSYDVTQTNQEPESIKSKAQTALTNWANTNINSFDSIFRNSKATAAIDAADNSIVSSQIVNRPFKKLQPTNVATTWKLEYNNVLDPDDKFIDGISSKFYKPAIESSLFTYDTSSDAMFIDNGEGGLIIAKLTAAGNYQVLKTNVGTIDYTTGIMNINSITISTYVGTALKIYGRCKSKDIKTKNASILQLNADDLTFNITQERL